MDETRLTTIAQLEQFLSANAQVGFSAHGDDTQRDAHISRMLGELFDGPGAPSANAGWCWPICGTPAAIQPPAATHPIGEALACQPRGPRAESSPVP
ncbi:hypothetical protein THIX_60172 [Thiomonas sp. X19]|nr:hypothetical protein THIX_60172 [Thiomonas sp. X19]